MKRKITLAVTLTVIALTLVSVFFIGCDKKEEYGNWKLSQTVTAKFSDNGKYGYILTLEGSGEVPDYQSEKDAGWYGKSGRVTEIVISDGITYIGKNAFSACVAVKQVILPASVAGIGENSFPVSVKIYTLSDTAIAGGENAYLYSETYPTAAGNFWRYKNGIITEWDTSGKVTKVLFIGNSFTYYSDIPKLFEKIAKGADKQVLVESVTQGSYTLEKFADPQDEFGKKVDGKLNACDDYDVVVLQEQSTRPIANYNLFLSSAKALQTKINATQKNCAIYLYSTWGYKSAADAQGISIPELELKIREAYLAAAKDMKAGVCNVGQAFTTAYQTHTELNLYFKADNKHPSYTGAYLSACVHAATILGIDPRVSSFDGVPADDTDGVYTETFAQTLKQIAYSVVFGG